MPELDLLREIRKRPGMYLGVESITRLDAFLGGYVYANFENGKIKRDDWIHGFQTFVDARYKNKLTIGWCDVILRREKDEAKAFRRFFQLLDEYLANDNPQQQEG